MIENQRCYSYSVPKKCHTVERNCAQFLNNFEMSFRVLCPTMRGCAAFSTCHTTEITSFPPFWALFHWTIRPILRNELVLMIISESFYQNLHLPLSETWCERVITLLRVGNRPRIRNSHTGSKAGRGGRLSVPVMDEGPGLPTPLALVLQEWSPKNLPLPIEGNLSLSFLFGTSFVPKVI